MRARWSVGLWWLVVATAAAEVSFLADFEEGGLDGMSVRGGQVLVQSAAARQGQYGVWLRNGELGSTWIPLLGGQRYKAQVWIRLVGESGSDWGGMRLEVVDESWNTLAHSGALETAKHGTNWLKLSLPFTASDRRVMVLVGYFGGPGRVQTAHVDDVTIRAVTGSNLPPVIRSVGLTPVALVAPASQAYALDADDADGTLDQVVWEFGDGTRAFGVAGRRTVGIAGDFVGRVTVVDEEGAVASATFSWSSARTGWPVLTLGPAPPDGSTTTASAIEIGGTASGAVRIAVSTDRGYFREHGGTNPWPLVVPLQPGWNRITVQAHGAGGAVVTRERRVRRVFGEPLAIEFVGTPPAAAQRWETVEILFDLRNSAATHPQFPLHSAATGLEWMDGVRVDGVFRHPDHPGREWRRPAFRWQRYRRALRDGEEWMYPEGEPVWCVRFSPPHEGAWTWRVEAREAAGDALTEWRPLLVRAPTDPRNRGPIRVSERDPRYFEHADGTYFSGVGHGIGFGAERFSYEAEELFARIGSANQNLMRWWIAGLVWGSAWQPWSSRTLPYEGTVPATGLALESAFGHGLAAWRLDATNPIMFQGFMSGHAGLMPGRVYRVRVRWRTEGITGPRVPGFAHGLCLKFVGWPEPGQTHTLPALVGPQAGDSPWHVAAAEFTAETHLLPNLAIIWENATAGRGYVDEVAVEEKLGPTTWGPNLLRSPLANSHLQFDARRGAGIEVILHAAQERGITFRLNIGEKQEFLLNHLSPQGLPDPRGERYFDAQAGAVRELHHAHWRHLFARFGAFRSIHSWELANEVAPGPGAAFDLAAQLERAAAADGNPHPAGISTWASLAEAAWNSNVGRGISHVDFHCYVYATGWIEPKAELQRDSARFFREYARAARSVFPDRPVVWGEMGLDTGGGSSDDEEPRLREDAEGIWLHKIVWARTGEGGVYPLYWWTDNIFTNDLHSIFGRWRAFIEPLPLCNGRYREAAPVTSDARLRAVGQKDLVVGRAHLWLDHAQHTWRAVVDRVAVTAITGTVMVEMDRANAVYDCEWFDPYAGRPVGAIALTSDANRRLTLPVTALQRDLAVRIARRLGAAERWRVEHFDTPENVGEAADAADPDRDGRPNLEERAFGTNPRRPDRGTVAVRLGGDPPRLTLEYVRRAPPRDVSFRHLGADDLRGVWSPDGLVAEVLTADPGIEQVRVRDAVPLDERPRRFLRVDVVSEPAP
ncbi:MAG: DUF5060 domain-containing protein [Kiritimatiellae bacterium]|nr:DUF5060 domain-containing protein [Kiritimatiellia bacterium]